MKKIIRTDISDFESLKNLENSLYVDKTEFIYNLVKATSPSSYYFISRPRRYGKSLMCSTLKTLFEGKREYFKDLYIDSTDYSFESFPVLYFNFAILDTSNFELFLEGFKNIIREQGINNGIKVDETSPSYMLSDILNKLEKKAVIVVDEFDAPVTNSINDRILVDKISETFSSFYSIIKNLNEKIRFCFITGVTKLTNMSIFSKMNNLTDISFSPDYASMFGYTEKEVEDNFKEHFDEYMEDSDREYTSYGDFIGAIRDFYDGYRFSFHSSQKVYNPVSVGSFFNNKCRFENYWQDTGVSTLAIELAKRYDLLSLVAENQTVATSDFSSFDITCLTSKDLNVEQFLALMYFTGYLTIESGNLDVINLVFPNKEVSTTFSRNLAKRYMQGNISPSIFVDKVKRAAIQSDSKKIVEVINDYFSQFPYLLFEFEKGKKKPSEKTIQLVFYSLFVSAGADVKAEDTTLLGRSDIVFSFGNNIYVLELKVDRKAEEAIKQMKDNRYYEKYKNRNSQIILLGISYSSKERKIVDYKEEIISYCKQRY